MDLLVNSDIGLIYSRGKLHNFCHISYFTPQVSPVLNDRISGCSKPISEVFSKSTTESSLKLLAPLGPSTPPLLPE